MYIKSLFCLCFFFRAAIALIWPEHNCTEYFTYGMEFRENSMKYMGIFTAPKAAINYLDWLVYFAWNKTDQNGEKHLIEPLAPYPNSETLVRNVGQGLRGQVFVRFKDITDELPMLNTLIFNGSTLCGNLTYKRTQHLKIAESKWSASFIGKIPIVQNTIPPMRAPLPEY